MAGVLQPQFDSNTVHVMTEDEAIALALQMCPDGESFSIHEATCAVTPENPDGCTCTPTTYRPGARA